MTDFFADLERELRAAHPRRSRPVVPAKRTAMAAVAAATLAAIVLALGAVGETGEREVAAPQPQEGWTAYAPLDCEGTVVDGRIPDALVDRFAILRGDGPGAELTGDQIPEAAAEVIRQSLRVVDGPGGTRYVFAIARMGDERCEPGEHAVCLISLQGENSRCGVSGTEPAYLVEDFTGGRRLVAVVAGDDVERVAVSMGRRSVTTEFDLTANTGFQVIPGGDDEPQVTAKDEEIPLGCSTEPAMSALEERVALFRQPPAQDASGVQIALPEDWQRVFLSHARWVETAGGRYLVFPAANAECDTGVCMVREGEPQAKCILPAARTPQEPLLTLLSDRGGGDADVAVLVPDEVASVRIRSGEESVVAAARDSVAFATVNQPPGGAIEVTPGS